MKGINDVLHPLTGTITAPPSLTTHPLFNYVSMTRMSSLLDTFLQYHPELLSLLRDCPITYIEDHIIMEQL